MTTRVLLFATVVSSCAMPYRGALAPHAFADADSAVTRTIARGVTHTFVHDRRGPWAFHVVEIDSAQCNPLLEARKSGDDVTSRATTSALAHGALVAINADFFALPGGTPLGAHVTRGVPFTGPTDRQLFGVTRSGWRIGVARLQGTIAARGDTTRLAQLNRMATPFSAYAGTRDAVTLFTPWMGDSVPADSTARRLTLRLIGDAPFERSGRAIIVAADSPAAVARLGARDALLHAHGTANTWARRRAAGDTVTWHASVTLHDEPVIEGVGGFPELLRGRRPALAQQTVNPSFGNQRHPRTALGWTADGRLLLVVVDGRQAPYSDGMSLDELTWLFQRLGATDALNLDGGGSTAMVIEGQLVNRPSDPQGERAVGNALALVRCGR